MNHLARAGGVLLGVVAVVLVVPRLVPVTETLEKYGFYARNDVGNAREWASRTPQYVDSSACGTCHQDKSRAWEISKHRSVACEDCHGPGRTHIDLRVALNKDVAREACSVCHAKVVARRSDFPQVDLEAHRGQATCVTCHNPHSPRVATEVKLPVVPHSRKVAAIVCYAIIPVA